MANKQDTRGRSKFEQHIRLTHFMLRTAAWRSLTPAQRAVYIELLLRYTGFNNGRIAAPLRNIAVACRINKDTAGEALKVLEQRGFIECVTPGAFSRKVRHAGEWRLTDRKCDISNVRGTNAFQRWRPAEGTANRG